MEDLKGYLQIWHSDRLSHNCFLKLAGLARSSMFWRVHTMCTAYSEQVTWDGIVLQASWNVNAHAQKPDLVLRRNWRVHLNRRGYQFTRLLAAEVCASAVVMLDTPCSEVVWRVVATSSIRQFPLHFPSRASPCAITFQLESTS